MTGFGRAEWSNKGWKILIEMRSVNQRGLKISFRTPDALKKRESELEELIAARLKRGHVFCTISCETSDETPDLILDHDRVALYIKAIEELKEKLGTTAETSPIALLSLPNVLKRDVLDETILEPSWPEIKATVQNAIDSLMEMRTREGENLAAALTTICNSITGISEQIAQRAPEVVSEYCRRLCVRVDHLLKDTGIEVTDENLHREIAFFAERSDITEEIERTRSHIAQFLEALQSAQPVGRKLEFLAQEIHREANTIGSKANDSRIVHKAVDLKTEVDRLREQALNVE